MKAQETDMCICGIGPGNPDLISKAVYNAIDEAEVLIGGKRHLETFTVNGKIQSVFDGNLTSLKDNIEKHLDKKMVVLVSGDTGFYSLQKFIRNTFPHVNIRLIPGISSFQYFYAKLGMSYEHAYLTSLHGTENNFIEYLKNYQSVFLLTDRKNNYKVIAQKLIDQGYGQNTIHIGNNLSYEDEQIISIQANEAVKLDMEFQLCCVIIES